MVTLTRMAVRRSAMRTPATMHTTLVMTRSTHGLTKRVRNMLPRFCRSKRRPSSIDNKLSAGATMASPSTPRCGESCPLKRERRSNALKSRTSRRRCGQKGHWSGEGKLKSKEAWRSIFFGDSFVQGEDDSQARQRRLIRCLLLWQPGQGTWRTGASTRKCFRLLPLTRRVAPTSFSLC